MIRSAAAVSLLTLWCAAVPAAGADRPQVVDVWPGKPPDESAPIGREIVRMSPRLDRKQVEVTEPTRLVTNVNRPVHGYGEVMLRHERAR
jgi:hypothetical protein